VFILGEVKMKYAVIANQKVANIVVASPEFAAENGLVEVGDGVQIGWDFDGQSFSEPAKDAAAAAAAVREERNRLLTETDWVVIKAFETNTNIPGAWEVYRQALRDVPQQAGFPWDVVWPTQPV
jgi:Phage tail assembly chaperone protein